MYREQQQIFLWDADYLAGLLRQTGGFSTLASQFLVQFFHRLADRFRSDPVLADSFQM